MEVKNIISKIPGFRSGKLWKEIVACFVYATILIIIFGPSPGTKENVEAARKHLSENNYSLAVGSYQKALDEWDNNGKYTFTKKDVNKEFNNAKTLLTVDELLNESLKYIESKDNDKAISKYSDATKLISDHPRIQEVKQKIDPIIKEKTNEYITDAKKALEEWDVPRAENKIALLNTITPGDPQFKTLQENLAKAQETIKRVGPKPVNSAWDGAVRPVTNFFKEYLKDPESVQYSEWSNVVLSTWKGEQVWVVRCKYRAKNSFGGYAPSNQIFYIKNDQVIGYNDF